MDAMQTDFRSDRRALRRSRVGLGLLLGPWLAAVGCGHHGTSARGGSGGLSPSASGQGQGVEVQALREALRERDERLKQLESRLALVEAEQRQFRYAIEDLSHVSPVPAKADAPTPKRGAAEPAEPARSAAPREEPRVVLRLHEEGVRPARSEAEDRSRDRIVLSDDRPRERAGLQDVPVVSERLPVAPLPSAAALSMGVAPIPAAPVRGLPVAEPRAAVVNDDAYAAALDALAARDFRNASALFERFMGEHPRDPRFAKAAYWRAEALFALHSYAAARAGFEAYLGAAPQGDRAPDAWLKLGHARARAGDATGAKAAFRELRSRFPNSAAARMSAEEEP
jgi:tol-pal system protein YbgF